jgi:hypothetical protein
MKVLVTLSALIMAFAVMHVPAVSAPSELVGIYTIVERVVLEPDNRNPQRIQLWGAFATNRTRANPQKGYMYFMLPNPQRAAAIKEWSDFKNLAGTGRVVSFGTSFFGSANQSEADAHHAALGRVRNASEKLQSPDVYPLNLGLSTISDSALSAALLKALKDK